MSALPADVQRLMRPSAAALEPYDPAFTPVAVNLSANENAYGLPESAHAAMVEAVAQAVANRYPVPLANDLRAALADLHGVAPEQVIVGNGGDELLFNLFLAFGGAGHTVVHCPPDFSVYDLYGELAECEMRPVWRDLETFALDEEGLLEAARDASVTIITSPNNPTSDLAPRALIERLCQESAGLVLADEAYMEFAPEGSSCVDLLAAYPNLLVLRTFSKAYALAGARVGYVMGSPGVISALAAVRQPYSVSSLDQAAALAVLSHREELEAVVAQIVRNREVLREALLAMEPLGVRVWPAAGNFLLIRVPQAADVRRRLRDEHEVLVRDFSSAPGLDGCLRVTVGTEEENRRFIEGLTAILRGE